MVGVLQMRGNRFVNNNGGIIRLTLTGIAAGTYDAIGYHMDLDNSQSVAIKVLLQTTPGGATFAQGGSNGNANFTTVGLVARSRL